MSGPGAGNAWDAAIARQDAFDDLLDRIRAEGADAFRRGVPKSGCPHLASPEPHHAVTWVGGWAEAALDAAFAATTTEASEPDRTR